MRPPLNAAVIGLGVGEQHARAYLLDPSSRLRWVHDADEQRSKEVLARLGAGQAAESVAQILADPETDLVSIASYDQDHAAQVVAALEAGKHVFCEKPLATSDDGLKAVARAHAGHPLLCLASNLVLREAPLYRELLRAVRAGELGQVYAIDGDYLYGRIEKITEGWRGQVPGYSVMLGGGVHLVDLMLLIAGERPRDVEAVSSRIATAGTDFREPDFVAATYTFPSGLVGRITANFGCVHRHQHVLRVFGTRATFLHDDRGARLHASRDPEAAPRALTLASEPATKGALIPPFLHAIAADAPQSPPVRHELDVVSACLAADLALKAERRLPIEYL